MNRLRRELSLARALGCVSVVLFSFLWAIAPAGAIIDDFSVAHDYTGGDLTGTIWTDMYNIPVVQNQTLHDAHTTNPGRLTVGDNGTFDADANPGNGISGMGWEGVRSNAPFLAIDVSAGKDFTATVKVMAQTSGNWSAAGLLARAPSATDPGNPLSPEHVDENFITMTLFRTDAANPNEGNSLMKMVTAVPQAPGPTNPAQAEQNLLINGLAGVPGQEPLPLTIKLERVNGATYRGFVSMDGGATYQFQTRHTPAAGNPLRDLTKALEVGLHYNNFGTLAGSAQFDDFELTTYDPVLVGPGAPTITASQTSFTVVKGAILAQLIDDTSGQAGPFSWVRTPNLTGPDAMIQGTQGGGSALITIPPMDQSWFRWETATVPRGTYTVDIVATNDWGQASNTIRLTITIVPEPSTIALAGLVVIGLVGSVRRRR